VESLARVRDYIRSQGWDCLWVTKAANRRYLTGFTGSAGWVLVPSSGRPVFMTDGRYTEQARHEVRGFQILISRQDPRQQLANLLKQKGLEKLGFEDEEVSVAMWRQLKHLFPALKGHAATGAVELARAEKTVDEITKIKHAAAITTRAYQSVLKKIKPGLSERELAFELEKQMMIAGSEASAFPVIVASGPNSALPHASPSERRLRVGDLLVMDFGSRYQGYNADLTRTVVIGKASGRQKEVYKTVKNAQKAAQKDIISGQFISQCDKNARRVFKQAGWLKYFVHSLGHGIGLEVHEYPRVSYLSQEKFKTGMVVTCEPGLYFPGWGGVRIEDDVLVSETSASWLSNSAEELQIVGRRS